MYRTMIVILFFLLAWACSNPTENESRYDAPADHTISKSGAKHKPGLNTPLDNCTQCHGNDLRGGDVEVSCFECHGNKW